MFELVLKGDYEDNYELRDQERAAHDMQTRTENTFGLKRRSRSVVGDPYGKWKKMQ